MHSNVSFTMTWAMLTDLHGVINLVAVLVLGGGGGGLLSGDQIRHGRLPQTLES